MKPQLRIVDDVPGAFSSAVVDAYKNRPGKFFNIALCGGTSPGVCYERLVSDVAESGEIDWSVVHLYWSDERCVPLDSPDSNYALAKAVIIDQVGGLGGVHPMDCQAGPRAYQKEITSNGGLDVVHLGMGADGHTASLFPDSPALNADEFELVALNIDPSGLNQHQRMTLTLSGIATARRVIFTVYGEAKRQTLTKVLRGEPLPAARVDANEVVFIVDPDAVGETLV